MLLSWQVDVRNNRMTPAGVAALVNAAFANGSVTDIDLSENRIGRLGALALAQALAVDIPTVASASRRSSTIATGPHSRVRSSLQSLTLSKCHLDDRAMLAMRSGLQSQNCRLTHLDLSRNQLGDGAGAVVGAMLNTPGCCLKTVTLEWNTIRKVRLT